MPDLATTTPSRPPQVLAMSSIVAHGHVGLSAIVPVLQRLDIEAIAVPTIVLSNHPGHAFAHARRLDPANVISMLTAMDRNGWLGDIDAILVGYLPTAGHVHAAAAAIDLIRSRRGLNPLTVMCDPVIGDDPKGLYIEEDAAHAIREVLVPRADILTPNRFEASWLSGIEVTGPETAECAARAISDRTVVVTSTPVGPSRLANVVTDRTGTRLSIVERRNRIPNGTGDAFSALLLAEIARYCRDIAAALANATGRIDAIATASEGRSELALIGNAAAWVNACPKAVTDLQEFFTVTTK